MDVQEGRLSARGVSYRYGTLDQPVLRDVSFELKPGECLVIKGVSGSGKSTLARLLTGLDSPSGGEILIDDCRSSYPVRGLSAVLQSDQLISASIRENIALYRRGIPDSAIWKALELCAADEFVRQLPMRLNSAVAEGMTGISGGQKQRILLARALVGGPKILLLDEATASLDVRTESEILRNLRQLGVTLVIISHRPEVWTLGDHLLEMAAGELITTTEAPRAQLNLA